MCWQDQSDATLLETSSSSTRIRTHRKRQSGAHGSLQPEAHPTGHTEDKLKLLDDEETAALHEENRRQGKRPQLKPGRATTDSTNSAKDSTDSAKDSTDSVKDSTTNSAKDSSRVRASSPDSTANTRDDSASDSTDNDIPRFEGLFCPIVLLG